MEKKIHFPSSSEAMEEAQLLVVLEQLEAVETALAAHPTDADLLRARAELTELLSLSSSLLATTTDHHETSTTTPSTQVVKKNVKKNTNHSCMKNKNYYQFKN